MGNIIVGQSGGPTSVINASLAGIYKSAFENNIKVFAMINGIQGLLDKKIIDLASQITSDLHIEILKRTPAAFLGSCRYKLPNIEEDENVYKLIFNILEQFCIDKFFYIGGNDSMDTIQKLQTYANLKNKDICFIGVPKTIDNDLLITDHTPGFGSACKYIATTTKEIIKDALVYDKRSVTIIETMGRNAGWLTASLALAKGDDCDGVDMICLPEVPFDIEEFVSKVSDLNKTKKSLVIAISEGLKNKNNINICELQKETQTDCFGHKNLGGASSILAQTLKNQLGLKTRAIELNTMQRCASHIVSKVDLDESFLAGQHAFKAALLNKTGVVVIFKRISDNPYEIQLDTHTVFDIANHEKLVPLDWIDTKNGYVKDNLVKYILPLIQGEVYPFIVNGLPKHLKLQNI